MPSYGGAMNLTRGAPARMGLGRAGKAPLPTGGVPPGQPARVPSSPVPFTAGRPQGQPPARRTPPPQNKNRSAARARVKATVTDPLAPLGPGQIKQQATTTINKAYGGAFSDLGSQTTQAQNLYKTQQADDAAFNQWLTTNTQAMQTKTDSVNQALLDVMTHIQGTQQQALAAQPGALAAQIAPGAADSQQTLATGLGALTKPSTDAANLHAANAAEGAVNAVGLGNTVAQGSSDIAEARLAQSRQGTLDTLNKTLNAIGQERSKLLASRTGDIAKEIARLNGIEISKAQFRVNQANLAQATGIKQQAVNVQKANAFTNATNANTNALKAQETARHNAQMESITSTHYATQAQHDAAVAKETARHNAVTEAISQQNANTGASRAAAAGAKGAKPKLTNTQKSEVTGYISTLRNALTDDINRYHRGQPNALSLAYHDIATGRYSKATGNSIGAPPLGADKISYLNAATNTLTDHGASGLTPGDVAFLNGIGYGTGGYPVKMKNAGTTPRQDAAGNTIGQ